MLKLKYLPVAFLGALCACSEGGRSENASATDIALAEEAGQELCRLTQSYELPQECERFERQYEELAAGVDAFQPSRSVREYETTVIRYAITRFPDSVQGGGGELIEAVPDATETSDDAAGEDAANADAGPANEETEAAASGDAEAGMTQEEIDTVVAEADSDVVYAIGADAEADDVEVRQVKLGRKMHACLDADASFEVAEELCQTLDTFEKPVAVWRWTVTPTEPGNHTLLVQSSVELTASDGSTRLVPQRGQDARISVEVTAYGRWKRFLAEAERWVRSPLGLLAALTALAGAIGLLIGAIRRARKGEGPPPDKGAKP